MVSKRFRDALFLAAYFLSAALLLAILSLYVYFLLKGVPLPFP
ncbi:MAG TPA: hypothetical protein VGA05_03395 [Candidatus Bathyarchaeia archaeon]